MLNPYSSGAIRSYLERFDEALKGKRIVYLGEMDHFVAERMEFRLMLIRELSRRGFRRIGLEMGIWTVQGPTRQPISRRIMNGSTAAFPDRLPQ